MARSRSKAAAKKRRLARQAQERERRRPTENSARRATWAGMLLEAAKELRDCLPVDESGYRQVAAGGHADARAYFVYSVTELLLSTSASIFRWLKLLAEMEKTDEESDAFWTESILDEQNGRIRKLVEALLDLICFQKTNGDSYYRHLMLLRELNRARGVEQDLQDFYACPNRNIQAQVERAAREVAALEAAGEVEPGRCWYSKKTAGTLSAEQLAQVSPGRLLTSARIRVKKALLLAEGHEKLALGISYDRLYSRTSGYIHFEPEGKPNAGVAAVSRALDEAGTLGLNVVVAVQRLLGEVPDDGWNAKIRESLQDNPYPAQLSELVTRGTAEVGDFVLAYGDLAEVLDTAESPFGYRSYRVRYLADTPMPGIDEDWFPAEFVRVAWSRQRLESDVRAAAAEGAVTQELVEAVLAAEGRDALRQSAAAIWNSGLGDYVRGRGRTPPR